MSLPRTIIGACLAGGIAHADDLSTAAFCVLVAIFAWAWTSDPLPGAIERGLEDFARRYRR